jgi:hypothetical protein
LDVIAAQRVRRRERLLNRRDEGRTRKIISQSPAIHVPFAGSRPYVNSAHRFLAAADRMNVLRVRHDYFSSLLKVSGVGCCAMCG